MKKKVTKRNGVKKAAAVKVARTKGNQPNWTGMVIGALLVVGLGWWVYKANTQSVDINLVGTTGERRKELPVGKWTFEAANEYRSNGVWRNPANGTQAILKDGLLTWNNIRSVNSIAAPELNLDFSDVVGARPIIRVKADVVQNPLPSASTRANAPMRPATAVPTQFKIVGQLYSAPFEEDGKRRLLGTQEVVGEVSSEMQEYELSFGEIASKRHVQLIRLFFVYPPSHEVSLTSAYRLYNGVTLKVDEVSAFKVVEQAQRPAMPTTRPQTSPKGR